MTGTLMPAITSGGTGSRAYHFIKCSKSCDECPAPSTKGRARTVSLAVPWREAGGDRRAGRAGDSQRCWYALEKMACRSTSRSEPAK